MDAREAYQQYALERIHQAIAEIPEARTSDIYAMSFWLNAIDDDPRRQVFDFNYNTLTQVRRMERRASGLPEATWNFAFWLQNEVAVIGHEDDRQGAELFTAWLDESQLNFSNEDEKRDFDRCAQLVEQIDEHFWQMSAEVGLRLHESGIIASKLGKPVPIIIHDLEYYDKVVDTTRAANPSGVADEFIEWVNSF